MIKFDQISVCLGKKKLKNSLIEKEFNLKKNSIFDKTGIQNRYISNSAQTSEQIAISCVKKIKKKFLNNITHILSVTNTPSYAFPSVAHFIASFLNFKNNNINCIGINSGCSGYVDALSICHDIIRSNKSAKILLTTSDTYSKFIRKKDKYIKCLFSDGGSASIISYSKNGWKVKKKFSQTLPNSQKFLQMNNLNKNENFISMDGPEIVKFALTNVIPKLKEFSRSNTKTILIHQAGKVVMDLVLSSINKDKKIFIPTNYKNYGNLISTSIPLVFYKNFKKVLSSKSIVLCGFGVGLTHSYMKLEK